MELNCWSLALWSLFSLPLLFAQGWWSQDLLEKCFHIKVAFPVWFSEHSPHPGFGWVGHFGLQPCLVRLLATIKYKFIYHHQTNRGEINWTIAKLWHWRFRQMSNLRNSALTNLSLVAIVFVDVHKNNAFISRKTVESKGANKRPYSRPCKG